MSWLKDFVIVLMLFPLLTRELKVDTVEVLLNAGAVVGPLRHFWESTGFCPPDPHQEFYRFILANDEIQNLAYIGSVPKEGIKQVRIHWLLDLVSMKRTQDRNFDDTEQIYDWRNLVANVAKHLIELFGLAEVSQWNFESWNEPQNKKHFDGLHVTTKGYLMYYDACSEGLKMGHPSLRLGGPATGYPDKHPIFWSLLQHCNNGTNFFTGQTGVRLDFISFHIKGQGHSMTILQNEKVTLEEMHQMFHKYQTTPVYNDEGDPLVGWSLTEDWRADATYAAIVTKILALHQNLLLKTNFSIRYDLLSNDNGFMNYDPVFFRQRTLLARFQMNYSHPRKVEFVKKPVLSVMGLLALLGDLQINSQVRTVDANSDFGLLPTVRLPLQISSSSQWELAVIFYNSDDTSQRRSVSQVNITVVNLPLLKEMIFVVYSLDNENGNPYQLWKHMGSPVFPTDDQLRELRLHQEPVITTGPTALPSQSQFNLSMILPLPGIKLIHICAKSNSSPSQVEGVRLIVVSSYEVLVTWRDVQSRCILTFEVLFSIKSAKGPFKRVNEVDVIFTSYHHTLSEDKDRSASQGWYAVVAVDYWERRSPISESVSLAE
ncbi:alpha-L-iduronidase-like isoform X2 [Acropora millepora]|uniref:alpha-L-iduronidase-like isoform X2 n=1 Tax=Acropora millepora TaxID=45264 RepID=UPI001CF25AB4|nr:alpha-L-iduronidase-like isoform X2 [Acropora millepora]